jgi:tryptophan-rich sensory protein
MQNTVPSRPLGEQVLALAGWLLLTFTAAAAGAVASVDAGSFYAELNRPGWAPPGALFGPVWTVLYLLMGVAAWLVWRMHGFGRARIVLSLFVVQLAANALWTWLFFVWRLGGAAFVEIVVLWVLIAGTMAAFWRLYKPAAVLLLPYLAWVSFACALTWSTWRLNPGLLS